MALRALLRPSLLRSLVAGALGLAIGPLLILALAVSYVADRVVLERFQSESGNLAGEASKDISDRIDQTSRGAVLIAHLAQTREAFVSRDEQAIRVLVLPLKSQLGLGTVNFALPDGLIIGGAQDPTPDKRLNAELVARARAMVESAWIIDEEPNGALMLRAIATVRAAGELIGMVEVGTSLDAAFLRGVQGASRADVAPPGPPRPQLGLAFRNTVRASTTLDGQTIGPFPPVEAIQPNASGTLVGSARLGDQAYRAIYALVETHQAEPVILGVFLSLEPVESARRTVLLVLCGLIAGLVLLIAYAGYRIAGRVILPLSLLAAAAVRIEAGDLTARVERRSPHEIGVLERAFDMMAESLNERERANSVLVAELQVQALNDPLTGLPNRILLHDRLRQTIAIAKRGHATFAFFMMDLDRFKEVNDTFGHQVGDRLIIAVGERLREVTRESDTVARFGGDEFAFVLPTTTTADQARGVARKLARALERPVSVGDLSLNVEASIGVTMYPEHGEDASTLVKRADAAMYVAKRTKSGHAFHEATEERASRDRLVLMGEFRGAIERNELILHYQPEVDPRTGRVLALEALVRWQHPTRGVLGPDAFIPHAEQTGLIRPLTRWVIDAALEQLRVWRAAGRDVGIAVNLSGRDFEDPLLAEQIEDALGRAGVPPDQLKLEITEGVVMAETARSLGSLAALHDMGVGLSMDDFGTGYSSLSYLKRLPVDEVKIDRSFVADISGDQGSAAIVRSTIELAHDLGRTVVAEGVEDRETVELLAAFGCDAVQGYYYGRPIPAADAEGMFVSGAWRLAERGDRPRLAASPRAAR